MGAGTIAQIKEIVWTIAWALVASVSMGLSLGLLIKFFDWMTPVNEWNQIRNGNIAMGIILGAVVLAFGLVVAFTLLPTNFTISVVVDGTPNYLKALAGQIPK